MKIVIIGGSTGFIGKELAGRLSEKHEVIVFTRNSRGRHDKDGDDKGKDREDEKGNKTEIIDMKDSRIIGLLEKYKPDIVVNAAGQTGLKNCNDNPTDTFGTNVYGTYNVIQGCLRSNSKLIFISSREVYGESQKGACSSENDTLCPNNILGITKMIAENMIRYFSDMYDLDYIILRPTNVYGPHGRVSGLYEMINSALINEEIIIFGGGQTLNFIYIDDLIDAIELTVEGKFSKETFNLCSTDNFKIDEMARIISDLIGSSSSSSSSSLNIKIKYQVKQSGQTAYFQPDLSKMQNVLKYNPRVDILTGLKKTIEWISNEGRRGRSSGSGNSVDSQGEGESK